MHFLKYCSKRFVVGILSWQVRRLIQHHRPIIIGVVGSYGKTSTKLAIATVLRQHYQVRVQEGNYNDLVSVPLVFFGQAMPSLFNPLGWLITFISNEAQIHRTYPYQVVVLELGTDGPGQLIDFSSYLHLDIAVLTSIAMEHMQAFTDLHAVAEEELSISQFSKQLVINQDLCSNDYIQHLDVPITTYGNAPTSTYRIAAFPHDASVSHLSILQSGAPWIAASIGTPSKASSYSTCAAVVVAHLLSIEDDQIIAGSKEISPVSGRMQRLEGVEHSTILDDTYNASPDAMKAALDTLYLMQAPQKIALLGNMNELGMYSEEAHRNVGQYCDPKQLQLVITLGAEANAYLAPEAAKQGCIVITSSNALEAGRILRQHIQPRAVILAKGSQNGVYAEEAVKAILAHPQDASRLVRQSPDWLKKKT